MMDKYLAMDPSEMVDPFNKLTPQLREHLEPAIARLRAGDTSQARDDARLVAAWARGFAREAKERMHQLPAVFSPDERSPEEKEQLRRYIQQQQALKQLAASLEEAHLNSPKE